jgi:chromosome segregation and condensation protein ScpB
VTDWDISAALLFCVALGVSAKALAELLPPVEAVMVRKINQHIEASHE